MPFERPTLREIYDRAKADILDSLTSDSAHGVSLADIHAKAISGAAHTLHGHIAHIATTLLPDSQDPETIGHWARITGTPQKPATVAMGSAMFAGENGSSVRLGAVLQGPEGRSYATTEAGTIANGTLTLKVRSADAGRFANLDPDSQLTLINPIAGVRSQAKVAPTGIQGGADAESDRELQRRYLFKLQNPPRGGHITDYIRWTEEVPGVLRAFVFRHHQGVINQVGVTFTITGDNLAPTIEHETVSRVRAHLEDVRPEAAKVTVFVPVAKLVRLTLKISPDTPAIRAAVTAEVKDLLLREAGVGGAFETDGTIYLSHLREAIGQAEGEHHHELRAPITDIRPERYEIATFGGIEWVT